MADRYSNDEATAAVLAGDAAYDNDTPTEAELAADGYGTAPTVTGDPLVNAVNTALTWSAALTGRWTPADITRTAQGVVAFMLTAADDAERITAALAHDGFETKIVGGRMFVRRAVAGAA